ncbi:MAG: hypothetical protein OXH19_13190 [Chloroflexi bacterium]|nr:hypothetical protein [Chloroflexota bacterium]MCY3588622.1 hypothetical protein [Chloroflexota bacterium]MCY3684566.1 hypothetical protein [Chloroflexota bacterium]MDE2710104.1 hypothetical protein [Chloroflexota bacterium]
MRQNDHKSRPARRLEADASVQPAALVHARGGLAADLDAWGHAGHLVLLQRVVESRADPEERRCLFWCESCKLWLLARLAEADEG